MRLPAQLLQRKPPSHKGDFGHILILAGSAQYSGAAILCSDAAARCGAGMITLGIPRSLISAFIKIKSPEVMLLPLAGASGFSLSGAAYAGICAALKKSSVLAIGPGLGRSRPTQNLIRRIIKSAGIPLVIDADGLNALAGHLGLLRRRQTVTRVLTPHPAEMSRLVNLSTSEVQQRRKEVAQRLARDYKSIVVLKGHCTVVAKAEGKPYINKTGNPGMAGAGSGDVLTGMIAAFLAQGLSGFQAAKYAVYLHGLAGDLAAKDKTQIGMVASDIIGKIPEAIKKSYKTSSL